MLDKAPDETLLNLVISAVGGEEGEMLDTGRDFPIRYAGQLRHIQTVLAERIRDNGIKAVAYVKLMDAAATLGAKAEMAEFWDLGMQTTDKIRNFKLQANLRLRLLSGTLELKAKRQFLTLFAWLLHAADKLPLDPDGSLVLPITGDVRYKEFIYFDLASYPLLLDLESMAITDKEFFILLGRLEKAIGHMPDGAQRSIFYSDFADASQKLREPGLKRQALENIFRSARKIAVPEQRVAVYSRLLETLGTLSDPQLSLTLLKPLQTAADKLSQEYRSRLYENLSRSTGEVGAAYKAAKQIHTSATNADNGMQKLREFLRHLQIAAAAANIDIDASLARAFAMLSDVAASESIYRTPNGDAKTDIDVCETGADPYCLPGANVLYTFLAVAHYDFEAFYPRITQLLEKVERASLRSTHKTDIYRAAARQLAESRLRDGEKFDLLLQLFNAIQKASGLSHPGALEDLFAAAGSLQDFQLTEKFFIRLLTAVSSLNNASAEERAFWLTSEALRNRQDARPAQRLLALLRRFAVAEMRKHPLASSPMIERVAPLELTAGNVWQSISLISEAQLLDVNAADITVTYQHLIEGVDNLKEPAKALTFVSWLREQADKMPDSAAKAMIYADLVEVSRRLSDSKNAAKLLRQALALTGTLPDSSLRDGKLYGSLLSAAALGDSPTTPEIMRRLDNSLLPSALKKDLYLTIAFYLDNIRDYRKAAEFAQHGLAIYPVPAENNDERDTYNRYFAFSLNVSGKAGDLDFLCHAMRDKSRLEFNPLYILAIIIRESG